MKRISSFILSAALLAGSAGLFGASPSPATAAVPATAVPEAVESVKAVKDPVKQLRGKLLYERNRIRKLERNAVAADPALAKQIQELDAKREALYTKAQPALAEFYANEKALLKQIDAQTVKK